MAGKVEEAKEGDDNYVKLNEDPSADWSREVRMGFIKKVFGIVAAQLWFTTVFTLFSINSDPMKKVLANPLIELPVVVMYFISICALINCGCDRKVPINYILLGIFTFCVSWIVASICIYANPLTVI